MVWITPEPGEWSSPRQARIAPLVYYLIVS